MNNSSNTVNCGVANNFFDSGGSGGNYGNSENFTISFTPDVAGQFIQLVFSSFATNSSADVLSFYDGPNTGSPLLGSFYGGTSPGTIGARNASGILTVQFTSNGSGVGAGWAAAITCVATAVSPTVVVMTNNGSVTTCGGIFYDEGGPSGNYANSSNQVMTLSPANASEYIQLNFSAFSTNSSSDFLSVYDGPSTASPLIGTFSVTASPGIIGSTHVSGSLTIEFMSNGSGVGAGWTAAISCSTTPVEPTVIVMTDGISVATCSGTFYDEGGSAGNYSNDSDQTMTINPANPGEFVQLTFSSFATNSTSDFLAFYDGPNTSSPLIGSYSVSSSPGTIGAQGVSGSLTVVFTSNGSGVGSGWEAIVSCSATPVTPSDILMTDGATVTTCGGTFYDSGGLGGNYSNDEDQTITFNPANPGEFIQLDFTGFSTNSSSDNLSIYDGPTTGSTLLGVFSGSSSPGTIGSTDVSGSLTLRFVSNGSGVGSGWEATVSCSATPVQPSDIIMTNGATVTTCTGTFYDEGGSGGNYSNSSNQTITFVPANTGEFVQLDFTSFITNSSSDILSFFDGPNTSSPLLGSFFGTSSPGTIGARNVNGEITVQFISNGSGVAAGWAATISCAVAPVEPSDIILTNGATITTCSGTFYDEGGSGGNYNNGSNLTMTFAPANTGEFVQLDFTSFVTNSSSDVLSFYDGPNTASPLLGSFFGTATPGTIGAKNINGELTVQFISNGSGVAAGWEATISCSAAPVEPSDIIMTDGAVVTTCAGTFYDEGGSGANYNNSSNLTMTFNPNAMGQAMRLVFNSFVTNSAADVLSIYDGPTTGSTLIGAFSGSTSPGTIDATDPSGSLTLQFVSNGSGVAAGWDATISCTGTPTPVELTSFVGSLKSNAVDLRWSTASELNNDFFTLERSTDGLKFNPISIIKGAGTTTSTSNYGYLDNIEHSSKEFVSAFYYRLKQTDFDGSYEYSPVIKVTYRPTIIPIKIYPNPGSGIFFIEDAGPNVIWTIMTATGQVLMKGDVDAAKFEIDMTAYGSGTYFLIFTSTEGTTTKRLILQK